MVNARKERRKERNESLGRKLPVVSRYREYERKRQRTRRLQTRPLFMSIRVFCTKDPPHSVDTTGSAPPASGGGKNGTSRNG